MINNRKNQKKEKEVVLKPEVNQPGIRAVIGQTVKRKDSAQRSPSSTCSAKSVVNNNTDGKHTKRSPASPPE